MRQGDEGLAPVAGNGLLHRRLFLKSALGGAALLSWRSAQPAAAVERRAYRSGPGAPLSGYGGPSPREADVQRVGIGAAPGTTGAGASRTPLERLEGVVTPSGLHFERHHSGVPDIDPAQHSILVHGLVKRSLRFSVEALARYPLVSRFMFLECSGNSAALLASEPAARTCGEIHGLVSASEWAGVPLSVLLDEAGVEAEAGWVIAEGADAATMARSVPLSKALDDAIVALYQNGERLRPENGYPVRLFLPGYEGNMSVKWLRRLQVAAAPAMTKDETSKYSDAQADGRAALFTFPMAVKSVITSPAGGLAMAGPGLYQISGLAWSGLGRIRSVEISADGGATWTAAALDEPVLPKALTRFRLGWRWDGSPSVLMSRAVDETGAVQPTRAAVLEGRAAAAIYHYNGVQAWQVTASGEIRNVYA